VRFAPEPSGGHAVEQILSQDVIGDIKLATMGKLVPDFKVPPRKSAYS
jgi:hypothetical protein